MSRERLYLYDTTLRDGAQTTGVDFSLEDKRAIATLLDKLGIDYVEGGYPGANPLDTTFFSEKRTKNAKFTAFGMTKRAGRSVSNDPGVAALLEAEADAITFVAKAWDYHVHVALETTLEENLAGIRDSVEVARAKGREVIVDCEHFFDGYKANPEYALSCAKAAYESGARWVVLCDTNGGTLPHEVSAIVSEVSKIVPGGNLGVHTHDDCGCAVANSLAAVEAGARHIQGTLNGLGERCGNANLVTLIGALKLKNGYAERFDLGVSEDALSQLTHVSRQVDEILNRQPNRHSPFVGASAFATKAGIHASAVLKDPRTYEHVEPELVGNERKVLVSDQGGRSNILSELKRLGFNLAKDDPRIGRVLDEVKRKEAAGFAFEGADASFYVLVKRMLGEVPAFFDVERFSVNVERRFNAVGELVTASEAIVKVRVGDEVMISAAEGNGPVNALDVALRKDLGKYQALIQDLELIDYKVRIYQGGSDAVTRVLIEFADSTKDSWTTIGVSANIIDASFQALTDSMTYKLLKSGAVL
ncbi:citramalate synthase [Microvirga flavescens]|uniref:citramalate synthase n=1 Tax=Microvirga flavescens TaxID=2249811 RepID=UPI000DD575D4|nr:citramalate synthase [Microvirga flavescens]